MEEQNHCSQDHDSGVTEMGTREELSHFKDLEMPCTKPVCLSISLYFRHRHLTKLLQSQSGCFPKSPALP